MLAFRAARTLPRKLGLIERAVAAGWEREQAVAWAKGLGPDELAAQLGDAEAEVLAEQRWVQERSGKALQPIIGWVMVAEPTDARRGRGYESRPYRIFRGYRDTGYRISLTGKRSRNGGRIGRRPATDPAPLPEMKSLKRYTHVVAGQQPQLGDRIWCPVCGTLNQLIRPEQLRHATTQ
jgi:hypothetical protein